MKVIGLINMKGGVGKTTLTMMFGEFLAQANTSHKSTYTMAVWHAITCRDRIFVFF